MRESLRWGRSVRRGAETFPSGSPGKAASPRSSLLPLSSFGDGPAGVELAGQAGGSRLHQGHGRGGLRGDERGAPGGMSVGLPGLRGDERGAPGGRAWGSRGTSVGLPGCGGGRKPKALEWTQKMTPAAPQTGGRPPRTRGGAVRCLGDGASSPTER